MPNAQSLQSIAHTLETVGQGHLLRYYDLLDDTKKRGLLAQIAALDLLGLPKLVHEYVLNKPSFGLPPDVQPATYYPKPGSSSDKPWNVEGFRSVGQQLLREGKVAAFVVAGGQGSRLGYDGPKGCYPAGAVTGKPLFQIFAEAILGAQERYGCVVPWYIMTSPLNHQQTIDFFNKNNCFGLSPSNVMFFVQGTMPTLDIRTGKILLSDKHEVATNPDGHGGAIRALQVSGALSDMKTRGVEVISYFQVDNPLTNILDPVFLGLHASAEDSSSQMSSKMVAKAAPGEKVGVFCMAGAGGSRKGRVEVVEYSDLPMEYQEQRNMDGSLRFNAGSIAVHALGVKFVEKLATDATFALPFHRAEKKVPCVDLNTGEVVQPTSVNGVKLEKFIFDALPLCERSIVLETDRIEEFAPIKNANGSDSPESCTKIQTLRAARWLQSLGVNVPIGGDGEPDCVLEISPRTGTTPAEVQVKLENKLPMVIERGQKLAL